MLDIIRKKELWQWFDKGIVDKSQHHLKNIQDGFILSNLNKYKNKRILEMGGGNSRVLKVLAKNNECWNSEKFEGVGAGPKKNKLPKSIKIVPNYMGDFSSSLPTDYFDAVFSISVLEHIKTENLEDVFSDCARVLRPGGIMLHAIDVYLFNDISRHLYAKQTKIRIQNYLKFENRTDLSLKMLERPKIDQNVTFDTSFATNSDSTMYIWNSIAPDLIDVRATAQSCSIKSAWIKV